MKKQTNSLRTNLFGIRLLTIAVLVIFVGLWYGTPAVANDHTTTSLVYDDTNSQELTMKISSLRTRATERSFNKESFVIQGSTAGTGVHFEIRDSDYLNITLDSTEEITARVQSVPEIITLSFDSDPGTLSTEITLSGLAPLTIYYKFEDNYHNLTLFITDTTGSHTYTQDISQAHFVFIQPKRSTKFIVDNATGGDCTLIGNWNVSTKTCTLTIDVNESIQIDSDNITLDGNNHMIMGAGTGMGVLLDNRMNVTIRNLTIEDFSFGIYLNFSEENFLINNTISNTREAISFESSDNNIVENNTLLNNEDAGILFFESHNGQIYDNTFENNGDQGLIFWDSDNIQVNDNIFENHQYDGIIFWDSNNIQIYDNTFINNQYEGVIFWGSNNNKIYSNTFENNGDQGLIFWDSDNIQVNDNIFENHQYDGLVFWDSENNQIYDNIFINNRYDGLIFWESNNNKIYNNTFKNHQYEGLIFWDSINDLIYNNTFENNEGYGLVFGSENVQVYNNNFINNVNQATGFGEASNVFNLSLPIGGNYWDNFDTPAEGCEDANSDNFCDTPFIFSVYDEQDNLPWTVKDGWIGAPPPPTTTINVAVILAEFSDVSHDSASTTAQPCKLIEPKSYPNGHDKTYYKDLAFCVTDYYDENSFGTVDLDFTIFDDSGGWFDVGEDKINFPKGKEDKFVVAALGVATSTSVVLSQFDIVAVVHEGTSFQLSKNAANMWTQTWSPLGQPLGIPSFKFIIAENDPIGFWAHEIGHIIGELIIPSPDNTMLPDLHEMGLDGGVISLPIFGPVTTTQEGEWGLMMLGSNNKANGRNEPPYMSSFTKEFLGWLQYDIHPKSDFGVHVIHSLDTVEFGDSIFRYNLENNVGPDTENFYILEARNSTLRTWDTSLPREKALVLYKVNTTESPKYGYKPNGRPFIEDWIINIPFPPPLFDGVLLPNGDSYFDLENLVEITALSDSLVDSEYTITAEISDISQTAFTRTLRGVILQPSAKLLQTVREFFPLEFNSPLGGNGTSYPVKSFTILPFYNVTDCCSFALGAGVFFILALMIVFGIVWLLRNRFRMLRNNKELVKEFFVPSILKLSILLLILFYSSKIESVLEFLQWYQDVTPKIIFIFNITLSTLFWYTMACFLVFVFRNRSAWRKIIKMIAILFVFSVFVFITAVLLLGLEGQIRNRNMSLVVAPNIHTPTFGAPTLERAILPDLDLHAITPDGRHVGVNYQTGEYEMEVPDTITNGDMTGDAEWILIPASEEVMFYVSSRDNQLFLDQNPDIAAQLTDTSDSYDIFARFIDPETDIFTSTTLENQTINPGETISHALFGTSDISIADGIERSVSATLRIEPKTLNLSRGGIFTVFIEFPQDTELTFADIDIDTLTLNGIAPTKTRIADKKHLIAEFNRTDFIDILSNGNAQLTLTGFFFDGTPLSGEDTVRVINRNILGINKVQLSSLLANLHEALTQLLALFKSR